MTEADQKVGNTALQELSFISFFFFFPFPIKGIDIFHKWKVAIALFFIFLFFKEGLFASLSKTGVLLFCKNVTFSPTANSWKFIKIYNKKQSFNFHEYAPGENVTFLQRGMHHSPQQKSIFLTK